MIRVSGENAAMSFAGLQKNIRRLYEGATPQGVRFRYALLAFDIVTLLFIIATSFLPSNDFTETLDVLFGIVILADFFGTAAGEPASPARLHPLLDLDGYCRDRFIPGAARGGGRRLSSRLANIAAAARLPDAGAAARRQHVLPAQ